MNDVLERISQYLQAGGFFNPELMEHEKVLDLLIDCRSEITRLREERTQIMRRRWVVRCGYYDDATAILSAIRGVHPPLVIEWTDDDGDVSMVEQMQPLPEPPGGN